MTQLQSDPILEAVRRKRAAAQSDPILESIKRKRFASQEAAKRVNIPRPNAPAPEPYTPSQEPLIRHALERGGIAVGNPPQGAVLGGPTYEQMQETKAGATQSIGELASSSQIPAMIQENIAGQAVGALDFAAGAMAERGARAGKIEGREAVAQGSTREGYAALLDNLDPNRYKELRSNVRKSFTEAQPSNAFQLTRWAARKAEDAIKSGITVGNEPYTAEWWGRQGIGVGLSVASTFGATAAGGPIAGALVGGAMEAADAARTAYETAIGAGANEADALTAGFNAAGKYAIASGVTEAVAPGVAGQIGNRAARAVVGGAIEGGTEALQTAEQELIVSQETGTPIQPGLAGRMGTAAALGAGAGGGAASIMPGAKAQPFNGRQMLTRPESVSEYVAQNPQGAARLAAREKPTRSDFRAAGVEGEFQASQRQQIAEAVRAELSQTPGESEATAQVPTSPEQTTAQPPAASEDIEQRQSQAVPSVEEDSTNPLAGPQGGIQPETAAALLPSTAPPAVSPKQPVRVASTAATTHQWVPGQPVVLEAFHGTAMGNFEARAARINQFARESREARERAIAPLSQKIRELGDAISVLITQKGDALRVYSPLERRLVNGKSLNDSEKAAHRSASQQLEALNTKIDGLRKQQQELFAQKDAAIKAHPSVPEVTANPEFDVNRFGANDAGYSSAGAYFTPSETLATGYAKAGSLQRAYPGEKPDPFVYAVELTLQNPWTPNTTDPRFGEAFDRHYERTKPKSRGADVDDYTRARALARTEALKELGYDGEIINAKDGIEYVAFDPQSIRRIDRNAPPQSAIGAAAAPELARGPSSVKNAYTEQRREQLGLPERDKPTPVTFDALDTKAKQTLEQNPSAGYALVEHVLGGEDGSTVTALSDEQNAVLGLHIATLDNELDRLSEASTRADQEGDTETFTNLQNRMAIASDELTYAMMAAERTGTLQGRALGSRRMAWNTDLSLAKMTSLARANRGGRQLTPEESETIRKLHEQIADLQKQLALKEAAAEQANIDTATDEQLKRTQKQERRGGQETALGTETVEDVLAEQGQMPDDFATLVKRLTRAYVRAGMEGRDNVMQAVHKAVLPQYPGATLRDVKVGFTDYGDFKNIKDKSPEAELLRQYRGELQQVLKIEDMSQGRAPLATGTERPTPGDVWRKLTKVVNEMKRRGGFKVTDPAKQLKTALDAVKTRLSNQIKDLSDQIRTREKIIKKKTELQYDEEATALRKRRDELKQEYDAIFGTKGLTDEQRLKMATRAAERSLAEYERRIAERDFSDQRGKSLSTPELEAIRAKRDAAKAQFEEMRAIDPDFKATQEQKQLAALKRHLAERIEKLTERMAKKDYSKKPVKPKSPMDAEAEALQNQVNELHKQFRNDLLDARAIEADKAEIARMKGELAAGTVPLPPPKRESREKSPEARRSRLERLRVKEAYDLAQKAKMPKSWVRHFFDALGIYRAAITTGEFSVVARQGGAFLWGHPIRTAGTLKLALRAMANPQYAKNLENELLNHPNALDRFEAGIKLIHSEEALLASEEVVVSRWVDKIPGIKHFNRFSRTYLNLMRAQIYDIMEASMGREATPDEKKALGSAVNVGTGRGPMGDLEGAMTAVNQLLFSARFVASRFQYETGYGVLYGKGATARTRKAVAKEYGRTLMGVAAFYALASLAGGDIEEDPRSSNFGKIKIGNTWIDPLFGLAQISTFLFRTTLGEKKTQSGRVTDIRTSNPRYGQSDWWDTAADFARSKLAPVPSKIVNVLSGTNYLGEPATPWSEFGPQTLVPITWNDVVNVWKAEGIPEATAISVLAFLGFGVRAKADESAKPMTQAEWREKYLK